MNKKLWESLNKVEEYFIDLEGIKQHLNLVVDNDSSKTEMESAIYFVVRLLDRYEEDVSQALSNVWEELKEHKQPGPDNKLNTNSEYSQLINSKLL